MLTSINGVLPVDITAKEPPAARSDDIASKRSDGHAGRGNEFRGHSFGRRHALRMFRQEVMVSLRARSSSVHRHFEEKVTDAYGRPETVRTTAESLLKTSKMLVARQSDGVSNAVLDVKETIKQAVKSVQGLLATSEETAAVKEAADLVTQGLDDVEQSDSPDMIEVRSTLTVDARQLQRSSIFIRTAEGDLVKLDLRRVGEISITDVHTEDAFGSSTTTEIMVSENSRLKLTIHGDLNQDEVAAIQDIFSQAESIADEFFSGDVLAAFEAAANLDVDQEQISGVRLRFSEIEKIRIAQTTMATVAEVPVAKDPAPPNVDPSDELKETRVEMPIVVQSQTESNAAPTAEQTVPNADTTGVNELRATALELVRDFMAGVFQWANDVASTAIEQMNGVDGIRIEISQSVNLRILQSVLSALSPEEAQAETAHVNELIDQSAEEQ